MQTEYLIIGQGICGTLLSYLLAKEGKEVMVLDQPRPNSSSRVASGVINPVTGKRVVKTWMIDELLPVATALYHKMEEELHCSILNECMITEIFARREEDETFRQRAEEYDNLRIKDGAEMGEYFHFHYGVGEISPAYLVDIGNMMDQWREVLKSRNRLIEDELLYTDLQIGDKDILYKSLKAEKVIFCEGAAGGSNPYFSLLPFSRNKGEAIIASIPGLPRNCIYKQGIKIVPWKEDLFWVGSSFEWSFDDVEPTEVFRQRVESHLQYWLKLPYKIIEQVAAERPTTVEYKPFVGMHPKFSNIGILNGMGTKGCSLAPYFAGQLARHLVYGEDIMPEVNVHRYARILSR